MEASVPSRLELAGISKQFPGVLANDQVSFSVRPGEIHALLGENGAGKSTLVKMIYGVMQPDAGQIRWNGEAVAIANPRQARRLGIGMVFQHFSLFEAMTVLENIALGMDARIPAGELEAKIRSVLAQYELALDPHRVVSTLSVGERQRIEIVRALLLEPSLLIMDEPTSVLTPQEVEQLFVVLRQLAAEGCSILYISHKLHEIRDLCDTATILRAGRVVDICDPAEESPRSMAEKMIGGNLRDVVKAKGRSYGAPRLVVEALTVPAVDRFGTSLHNVSFAVRAGEIFGVAGVAGNGQSELLLALDGEVPAAPAAITISGEAVGGLASSGRRKRGLCAVPEERHGHAAVPNFSLTDNAVLTARDRLGDFPDSDTPDGAIVPAEGRKITNIVMMGMGEPLYNFDNVRDALKLVMDGDGLALSKRRITLSTSGVVPMMARAGEEIGVNLAVSLHATNKEVRDEIVPLNRKYGIEELLEACAASVSADGIVKVKEAELVRGIADLLDCPMPPLFGRIELRVS